MGIKGKRNGRRRQGRMSSASIVSRFSISPTTGGGKKTEKQEKHAPSKSTAHVDGSRRGDESRALGR